MGHSERMQLCFRFSSISKLLLYIATIPLTHVVCVWLQWKGVLGEQKEV